MLQTIQNNIPEPNYRLGAESFCYWLQGFFEIADPTALTEKQVKMIKEHLNMVFIHKITVQSHPILTVGGQQVDWVVSGNQGVDPSVIQTVC